MKIIGLLPAKNEAWVLRTALPQLKRFVDEFIVFDGNSIDGTADLVRQQGGIVLTQSDPAVNFSHWRQALLDEGRARGGTHFVWLDADEALTTQMIPTFRDRLELMRPGHKLVFDWLCLWKDARRYRSDESIWSALYKDFVFCDDGTAHFSPVALHEGRTPGPNSPDLWTRVPREEGAVLHFQFVPFARFQMKQALVRCRERLAERESAEEINSKYRITMDTPDARTQPIPDPWLEGLTELDALKEEGVGWLLPQIFKHFDEKGIEFFEPMEIWHIRELRQEFLRRVGREPVSTPAITFTMRVKRRLKRLLGRTGA